MPAHRKAVVIHSPHSGRALELDQALAYLEQVGIKLDLVVPIAELDNHPAQGPRWLERGIDVAIAAGGDGLVGGVISHIVGAGPILGILPLGTSNDIARSLRIPLTLPQAADTIAWGREQEIDVGMARPAEQTPHLTSDHQRGPVRTHVPSRKLGFFAHALTVGLNVQFARLATSVALRQRYGRLTYPLAALEALRKYEALEVQLRFDGLALPQAPTPGEGLTPSPGMSEELSRLHCHALQVAIIDAPIFGGQWQLAVPGGSISDGLLDIIVIDNIDFRDISIALARLFTPREQQVEPSADNPHEHLLLHHPAELSGIPGIHHMRARGVTITTDADPRDVTLDGEVRGQTPIQVSVANERLRVTVPQESEVF
ncbi:MAG: diacylglycerol kinase family protein [Ktedonobacteraceae bacterium]